MKSAPMSNRMRYTMNGHPRCRRRFRFIMTHDRAWKTARRGNKFLARREKWVKNNQDNQIQNITLCNNMYFSKKRYIRCAMEPVAKPPESGELPSFRAFLCQK